VGPTLRTAAKETIVYRTEFTYVSWTYIVSVNYKGGRFTTIFLHCICRVCCVIDAQMTSQYGASNKLRDEIIWHDYRSHQVLVF
jgi:hypothetical protein